MSVTTALIVSNVCICLNLCTVPCLQYMVIDLTSEVTEAATYS
jgi:hypothetical protein